MTLETCIKFYKKYMAEGKVDKAKAIFPGGLPDELIETPKEEKKIKAKVKK